MFLLGAGVPVYVHVHVHAEQIRVCVLRSGDAGHTSLSYQIAKKLVFKKVRKALGLQRCTKCYTGAAPITKDTLEFFLSLDVPLYELYGMSESSGPHTVSLPEAFRLTRSGPTSRLREDADECRGTLIDVFFLSP